MSIPCIVWSKGRLTSLKDDNGIKIQQWNLFYKQYTVEKMKNRFQSYNWYINGQKFKDTSLYMATDATILNRSCVIISHKKGFVNMLSAILECNEPLYGECVVIFTNLRTPEIELKIIYNMILTSINPVERETLVGVDEYEVEYS